MNNKQSYTLRQKFTYYANRQSDKALSQQQRDYADGYRRGFMSGEVSLSKHFISVVPYHIEAVASSKRTAISQLGYKVGYADGVKQAAMDSSRSFKK